MANVLEQITVFPTRLNAVGIQLQEAANWVTRLSPEAATASGITAAYAEASAEYRTLLVAATTLVAQLPSIALQPWLATEMTASAMNLAQRLNALEQKAKELQTALDVAWKASTPELAMPKWAFPAALIAGGLYVITGRKPPRRRRSGKKSRRR